MQPEEEMRWEEEILEVFQEVFEISWPFPIFESLPFLSQVKVPKLPTPMATAQVSGCAALEGKLFLGSFFNR